MKISVILSTYNNPRSLQKCLVGYGCQTWPDFELLIADDGSGDETRAVIADFARQSPLRIDHIWQEHRNFGKPRVVNEALRRAAGEYLLFSDGDCIPRRDFVAAHARHAQPNYFLTGGSHLRIPEPVHVEFRRDDVEQQRVFSPQWLKSRGMANAAKYKYRLTANPRWAKILNLLTPRAGSFIGCNASAWKSDILAVNGFDEDYATYGTEDKDIGLRLTYHGVQSRRLKYSLVCIHLDHPRPYSQEEIAESFRRLRQTKTQRATRAAHGLQPLNVA
jgi:glycosyltransferase involved in cell wall biosynthesis